MRRDYDILTHSVLPLSLFHARAKTVTEIETAPGEKRGKKDEKAC
jgi:hypothetical protein